MTNLTDKRLAEIAARCEAKTDTRYYGGACAACDTRQDIPDLLAEIKRLRGVCEEIIVESAKVDRANWPKQQQICQGLARKGLG